MFTVTSIYLNSCLHFRQNVFTNLYTFFCTNISTIFRSSHRKCSIKKATTKYFVTLTGKHPWWGRFFVKLHAIRPVILLKWDSNTNIFLWISWNFKGTPILKNICERMYFWKVFCDNIFQVRTYQKQLLMTFCVKGCSN